MKSHSYDRKRHLPLILRVPNDWLKSDDPEIGILITARLARAITAAAPGRQRSLLWALEGERRYRGSVSN